MPDNDIVKHTPLEQFTMSVGAAREACLNPIYVEACPFCNFAVTTPDHVAGACGWCGRFVWFVGWRGWRDRLAGAVVQVVHEPCPIGSAELVAQYHGWCERAGFQDVLEDDDEDDDDEDEEDEERCPT